MDAAENETPNRDELTPYRSEAIALASYAVWSSNSCHDHEEPWRRIAKAILAARKPLLDALEQAQKERDLAKAESSFFNTVIDLAHAQRDQAQEWAKAWHSVAETICLLAGVAHGLGADEMASAFRDKWDEIISEREQAQKERDANKYALDLSIKERDNWWTDATNYSRQRDQAQQSAKDARALTYEECAKWLDEQAEGHYDKYNRNPSSSRSPLNNYAADEISRCAAALRARIEAMLEQP